MPNILFKTIKSLKAKVRGTRPAFIESPFPGIALKIIDKNNQDKIIVTNPSNQQGETSLNLPNGLYIIVHEPFDTYPKINSERTIPLGMGKNIIEVRFTDASTECYYLKRRIAHLIRKGTDQSLAKAEQIIAQIKENHNNYREIPELNFVVRLELRLQHKLEELETRMGSIK